MCRRTGPGDNGRRDDEEVRRPVLSKAGEADCRVGRGRRTQLGGRRHHHGGVDDGRCRCTCQTKCPPYDCRATRRHDAVCMRLTDCSECMDGVSTCRLASPSPPHSHCGLDAADLLLSRWPVSAVRSSSSSRYCLHCQTAVCRASKIV